MWDRQEHRFSLSNRKAGPRARFFAGDDRKSEREGEGGKYPFFSDRFDPTLACEDNVYDLITCNLVLEHIKDLSHIFSEAGRVMQPNGRFLVNELHPFKQYQGTKARFERDQEIVEVEAYVHHISDFTKAAHANGLKLVKLDEYWHAEDRGKPPRLISLIFVAE